MLQGAPSKKYVHAEKEDNESASEVDEDGGDSDNENRMRAAPQRPAATNGKNKTASEKYKKVRGVQSVRDAC